MMRFGVSFCDKVSVISQITRAITIQAGVPVEKLTLFISVSIRPVFPKHSARHSRRDLRPNTVFNLGG